MVELAGYSLLYRPRGLWLAYGLPLRRNLKAGKLIEAAGDDCSGEIPLHRVGGWRKRIGANALKRLPGFLAAGTARAAGRRSSLEAIDGISVLGDAEGDTGVWPFLQVLMPTEHARDEALGRLWPAGLGVGRLFIHALADYAYLEPEVDGAGIPNARDFAARMLTVTNSEWLDEGDFAKVCRVLEESVH
jgi:dTDP-4-amino-4,6-dideoxygalactose transaminase